MQEPRRKPASTPEPSAGWNAPGYHQLADPQLRVGLQLLEEIQLSGTETVIDAGCGSGRLTEHLLERLPRGRVIAVDSAPGMVAHAAEVLSRHGARAAVLLGDVRTFSLPQAADGIFCSSALHFVPEHALAFRNFAANLRENGFLAAQLGTSSAEGFPMYDRLAGLLADPELAGCTRGTELPRFFGLDPERARALLEAEGFVDIRVGLRPMLWSVESPERGQALLEAQLLRDVLARIPDPHLVARLRARVLALATEFQDAHIFDLVVLHARRGRARRG